jgi:predicted MFS family arabinose efflux permease
MKWNNASESFLMAFLSAIQFVFILDFSSIGPFAPLLVRELHLSPDQISNLVSAYSFAAAFSTFVMAGFIDRINRKHLLCFCLALSSVSLLICSQAQGFMLFFVGRMTGGIAGGILAAMVQTLVGDLFSVRQRGKAMGQVMAAASAVSVIGIPLSLLIAEHIGWRPVFLIIAFLMGCCSVLSAFLLPNLTFSNRSLEAVGLRERFRSLITMLFRRRQLSAIVFVCMNIFASFSIPPFLTLYMTGNVGLSQSQLPLLYIVIGGMTFYATRWIGRLTDLWGSQRTFTIFAGLSIIGFIIVTRMPALPFIPVLLLTGGSLALISGRGVPSASFMTGLVPAEQRAALMSLLVAVRQLSMAAAAFVGGLLIRARGDGSLAGFDQVGYIAVLLTLICIWQFYRLSAPSQSN